MVFVLPLPPKKGGEEIGIFCFLESASFFLLNDDTHYLLDRGVNANRVLIIISSRWCVYMWACC